MPSLGGGHRPPRGRWGNTPLSPSPLFFDLETPPSRCRGVADGGLEGFARTLVFLLALLMREMLGWRNGQEKEWFTVVKRKKDVSDLDFASYLAAKRIGPEEKPGKDASARDYARSFLSQLSVSRLYEVLKDPRKKVRITVEWVVDRLLDIFYDSQTTNSERLQVIDRFEDYIRLGAMQDPGFLKSVRVDLEGGKEPKMIFRAPEAPRRKDPYERKETG